MPELFPNEELCLRFIMRRRFNKSVIFTLFRNVIAGETPVPAERLARLFDQLVQNIKSSSDVEVVINQNEMALHIFQEYFIDKFSSKLKRVVDDHKSCSGNFDEF